VRSWLVLKETGAILTKWEGVKIPMVWKSVAAGWFRAALWYVGHMTALVGLILLTENETRVRRASRKPLTPKEVLTRRPSEMAISFDRHATDPARVGQLDREIVLPANHDPLFQLLPSRLPRGGVPLRLPASCSTVRARDVG
jgi:hypothetical protein